MHSKIALTAALACVVAAGLHPSTAQAQKQKTCHGTLPDSAYMETSPVYRDCDVDKPTKIKGNAPRVNYQPNFSGVPRDQCWAAGFEFVVDTNGVYERETVRTSPGNEPDLEDAVRATLDQLRFEPARRDNAKVRQVYVHRFVTGVVVRAVATTRGGAAVPGPPPAPVRPPKC